MKRFWGLWAYSWECLDSMCHFFISNMNRIIIHFSKQTHTYTCLKEIKGLWRLKPTAEQQQMSSHFQMKNARYDLNKEKLLFSIKILRTISLSLEISWTGKYLNLRDSFGTILIGSLVEFGLNRDLMLNKVCILSEICDYI